MLQMALPPTIPTSFAPRAAAVARRKSDFGGVISFFSYGAFGVVFLAAIGLFFYGRILDGQLAAQNAKLAKAESSIDPATVESFVQLRDRLDSSRTLLAKHRAFSGFFSALSSLTPQTVRFTSVHVTVATDGTIVADGSGVSKSFNALSSASANFAKDGRLHDVIFSKMTINKDSSVSFAFSASVDPSLIAFNPSASATPAPAAPAATTTATTTTP